MNRYKPLTSLLLPSAVVGLCLGSHIGPSAFCISPLFLLFPLTQIIVRLTIHGISFGAAAAIAAALWVGTLIGSQLLYSRQPRRMYLYLFVALGMINAALIPWSISDFNSEFMD